MNRADEFHVTALQLYMSRFNFVFDPLDIALRRLLMDLCLPKETQQIDRVMEGFAKRYAECNPGLFVSEGAWFWT
jgi:Sec7-like guanine-nucleotide exchange factor